MQGKGKVTTYWLLGEDCQEDEDLAGKEEETGCSEDHSVDDNQGAVVEDLEERSFQTKVTFHVSDHNNDSHDGNNIKLNDFKNSTDGTKNATCKVGEEPQRCLQASLPV